MAKYFDVHPQTPQARTSAPWPTASAPEPSSRTRPTPVSPWAAAWATPRASNRIRSIRRLDDRHHFTLMCENFAQLGQFVHIDNAVFRAIKAATPGSYTFILPATKEVPRRLMHPKKKTVGSGSPTTSSRGPCSPNSASPSSPAPCSSPARTSR